MTDSPLDRVLSAVAFFGAGVAVGLLLAPRPGDATRRQLADSARATADAARTAATDFAEPLADSARGTAHRLAERHVPFADDLELDARDIFDDLGSGRG